MITIERLHAPFHLRAANERGHTVEMDSGAEAAGASPMELLLMGLGGCSGIDLVDILTKGRQTVTALHITLDGERTPIESAKPWTRIQVHYALEGDLDADKVRRAVELSLTKYCSVAKMLEKTAAITATFSVNGERFDSP